MGGGGWCQEITDIFGGKTCCKFVGSCYQKLTRKLAKLHLAISENNSNQRYFLCGKLYRGLNCVDVQLDACPDGAREVTRALFQDSVGNVSSVVSMYCEKEEYYKDLELIVPFLELVHQNSHLDPYQLSEPVHRLSDVKLPTRGKSPGLNQRLTQTLKRWFSEEENNVPLTSIEAQMTLPGTRVDGGNIRVLTENKAHPSYGAPELPSRNRPSIYNPLLGGSADEMYTSLVKSIGRQTDIQTKSNLYGPTKVIPDAEIMKMNTDSNIDGGSNSAVVIAVDFGDDRSSSSSSPYLIPETSTDIPRGDKCVQANAFSSMMNNEDCVCPVFESEDSEPSLEGRYQNIPEFPHDYLDLTHTSRRMSRL
ncbi:hypothetical protein ScPMuIL_007412 [Solemya velum]